jgi:sulfur carrier protein
MTGGGAGHVATIRVLVNGEETAIPAMSVHDYLVLIDGDNRSLAVELNRDILPKKNYRTTFLKEGDQLEIVWFVGGG